jgi:hypothetical protein
MESLRDINNWINHLLRHGEASPHSVEEMQIMKNVLDSLGIKYTTVEQWEIGYVLINLNKNQ